jgi:putative ABC transport system permease protein
MPPGRCAAVRACGGCHCIPGARRRRQYRHLPAPKYHTVRRPEELAQIRITDPKNLRGNVNSDYAPLTNAIWERVRDTQQGFSGVFAWSATGFNLASGGQARYARGLWVSGAFFQTLGCGSPGVVIGYGFWQKEFGGDAGVIGRKLLLDDHPFEIVLRSSASPARTSSDWKSGDRSTWLSSYAPSRSCSHEVLLDQGSVWWLSIMGRLKPRWTMERAGAELGAASPGIFESSLREEYSNPLWSLLAITGVVLLIACANLANLTLARASAREREIAVRLVIGAPQVRVMRHVLAESLLVAGSGALAAIFVARELIRFLVSFLSTEGFRPGWARAGVHHRPGGAHLRPIRDGCGPSRGRCESGELRKLLSRSRPKAQMAISLLT